MGDSALVVEFGRRVDELTHHRVQAAAHLLENPPLTGVTEVVPAFTTVTLFYDPVLLVKAGAPAGDLIGGLAKAIRTRLEQMPSKVKTPRAHVVEVPVCYGGPFGPDLEAVAAQRGLTPEEVVRRHSCAIYLVYVIGFSPGFPYLGGLPESLQVPRRAIPRTSVAPGSVGIANDQSCIYPMATPGGWNLVGRTPLKLFRWDAEPPTLLRPGDRVKFRAITPEEFAGVHPMP
jgi:inhibitor of KinA